jgi:hypothetical protein
VRRAAAGKGDWRFSRSLADGPRLEMAGRFLGVAHTAEAVEEAVYRAGNVWSTSHE